MVQETLQTLFIDEGISTPIESEMDFIALARKGVTKRTLQRLADYGGISIKSLAQLLPISERTIQRYEDSKKFSPDVSEHLIVIARVLFRGHEVFSDKEALNQWLTTSILGLGQRTPLSLLDTSFGAQLVMDELGRLERGVYS